VSRLLAVAAGVIVLVLGFAVLRGGVFGPQTPAGDKLEARDARTGVAATAYVDGKQWGSEVTLSLAGVQGPNACKLIAVSRSGRSEVVMGWTVPDGGYGTAQRPQPLVLRGATELPRADLARLEVRDASGAVLVSVPA
jgi:hypothetical protein